MVRDSDGWGKTDDPRPCLVSRDELDLRWELAFSDISDERRLEILDGIEVLVAERTHHASE